MRPPAHDPGDPRMRFRVWVDGMLVGETWVDARDADAEAQAARISEHHLSIAQLADAVGSLWLVEVFDPARPVHSGAVRWGTDPAGMVDPIPITEWPWKEER